MAPPTKPNPDNKPAPDAANTPTETPDLATTIEKAIKDKIAAGEDAVIKQTVKTGPALEAMADAMLKDATGITDDERAAVNALIVKSASELMEKAPKLAADPKTMANLLYDNLQDSITDDPKDAALSEALKKAFPSASEKETKDQFKDAIGDSKVAEAYQEDHGIGAWLKSFFLKFAKTLGLERMFSKWFGDQPIPEDADIKKASQTIADTVKGLNPLSLSGHDIAQQVSDKVSAELLKHSKEFPSFTASQLEEMAQQTGERAAKDKTLTAVVNAKDRVSGWVGGVVSGAINFGHTLLSPDSDHKTSPSPTPPMENKGKTPLVVAK